MYVQEDRSSLMESAARTNEKPGLTTVLRQNRERLAELDAMAEEVLRRLNGETPCDPAPELPQNLMQEALWQTDMMGRLARKLNLTLEAMQ